MMLVKCPRCGFSQPQDKYCAQCGVDMETFTPPRKSAVVRYLKNPLLYLATALVVICMSIFTLYKQDKTDIAQRVRFLKGSLQIASTNGLDKKATEDSATPQAEVSEEEEVPAVASTSASTPAIAALPSSADATKKAAVGVAVASGPFAYIYYAEVPRDALERLYQESQATGQFNSFGDYTAGILPDMRKRIMAPGLKIHFLEKSEKAIAKTQQWFTGIHDPEFDEDLGLSTFIELAEVENNIFRGNLEIVRSLREIDIDKSRGLAAVDSSTGSAQKNSYPAIFELGPGHGFFIAGVLPRKTQISHEEELVAKAPTFSILRSPAFQNKQSEFVIFIEFEKKP